MYTSAKDELRMYVFRTVVCVYINGTSREDNTSIGTVKLES